jgi:hypothetical protein
MSDQPEDLTRPPPDDTDETPSLPDPAPSSANAALAASLAELSPAPANLNRDRLMFEAGAGAHRWVVRLWQLAAGFLAATGFFAGMYFRPPRVVEREVYVQPPADPRPAPPGPVAVAPIPPASTTTESPAPEPASTTTLPSAATDDQLGWIQIRNDVLSVGVGAIPDHGRQPAPAPNVGVGQPGPLPRGVLPDQK